MKFSKGEIICREDLSYPEGALVCDGYDEGGRLLAHPLGGGFRLTVPAQDEPRFRVVAEAERAVALFHRGRFRLADGERAFEDWSNGELWNGWAMPRFELAVCQEILKALGLAGGGVGERGGKLSESTPEFTWQRPQELAGFYDLSTGMPVPAR